MHPIDKKLQRVNFYREIAIRSGHFTKYVNEAYTNLSYIAKDIHHSSKIEGNTISLSDTEKLLTGAYSYNEILNRYTINEVQEITGLKRGIGTMLYHTNTNVLSEQMIKHIHDSMFYDSNTLRFESGKYRQDSVGASDGKGGVYRVYTEPRRIRKEVQILINNWNNSNKTLEDIASLKTDFVVIHPFADGNGRVARLLLNWALITSGYVPIIIPFDERDKYINTLAVHDLWGDMLEFLDYLCDKLLQVYKEIV